MDVDVEEHEYNDRRRRSRFSELSGDVFDELVEINNAFRDILKTFYLQNGNENIRDLCLLLTAHKQKVKDLIGSLLVEYGALKFNIMAECSYIKPLTEQIQIRSFKTHNRSVFHETSKETVINDMIEKLCREEGEYQGKGSGWSLYSVDGFLVRVSRYRPLRGSSFIPLPKSIQSKHCIINPKNMKDNNCFQWAILAKHVSGKNCNIIDNRYLLIRNKYNFNNINFPTPIKQIVKFEKQNPGVSVNVYSLNAKNEVYPLKVCNVEEKDHFDLLLLSNSSGVRHYCYIKHFSRFIRSQLTNHTRKALFCKRCFKCFQGVDKVGKLKRHVKDCVSNKPVKVIMPSKDEYGTPPVLKFENHLHKLKVPIVLYADFECLLKKTSVRESRYTTCVELHEPMSFCVYLVYDENSLSESITRNLPNEPYLYRGENASKHFLEYLIDMANLIGDLLDTNITMIPMTTEEQDRFDNATNCESCNCRFTLIDTPVRDHCHFTGRFRSVLCNSCNLNRQSQKFIPVYLHGSSKYDNHFIIKELGCDQRDIRVIPNTGEKFVSFSKRTASGIKLRFIDTFRFLSTSLSELARNLPKDRFIHSSMFFEPEDLSLVTKKGVYPYEYTDSWEKLLTNVLPPKESFYNSMTDSHISDEDYNHATKVWQTFNCKSLGEYSDIYLRTDVLLLTDIYENFRNLCLENYELDPSHYLTLPSFTFDAMLKVTSVELELLTDYDKYLFIERGIRGGITSCIKRHAKANNPHVMDYDENKEITYLSYIDANNLYGWAMSNSMPKNNFKWLSKKKVKNFDVMSVDKESPVGYFLECDIAYPGYLNNYHNDLPFLPENKIPKGSKNPKLLTTLEDKTGYICHYLNLKQALENGLILKKIHRVLSFNQSQWLKVYIEFNTDKRKLAKNNFEKDFYKLLNNAMFGKSMENLRNRINLELVCSEKKLNRLISKPNFKNRIVYDKNLCAVECTKEKVYFNKPIYVGFTVLELSKYHMYEFHYNVMKKFFKDKISILYVDTDSFFYEIRTDDLYNDFLNPDLISHFDLSDYPCDHKCFSTFNKKVIGKFKDETCSVVIVEFIGLRPKLYCFRTINDYFKKAKGVSKPVIKNHITISDYRNCLFANENVRKDMRIFRSTKHTVKTVIVNKLALSCNDDKRFICDDGVNTLAYGHYKLKNPDLSFLYE